MPEMIATYWPPVLAFLTVMIAVAAASHAALTKDEVRSAIGWVGIILLSPLLGALLYTVAGVNRMRRSSIKTLRLAVGHKLVEHPDFDVTHEFVARSFGQRFAAMKQVGDRITYHRMTTANRIHMLESGDETYAAMVTAIQGARRSVLLESYIFDNDRLGRRVADALIEAHRRGVEVRVLIDAVGARYSRPSLLGYLRAGGVPAATFNGRLVTGLRLPYANMRTHRKILVVDGVQGFMGGMNIRQSFTAEFAGDRMAHDTHFHIRGPVLADIFSVAAEDWYFARKERLDGDCWRIAYEGFVDADAPQSGAPMLARVLPSGPDSSMEANHKMLMGAFSVARETIRIMSPYFLPDRELISALTTAARRGVQVDIVIPANNNLAAINRAMLAQLDQVLRDRCRVWRVPGAFDHSKLLVVDSSWVFAGSSNLDPRSLRLNFEVDLEVLDCGLAEKVEARIKAAMASAEEVTLGALLGRPFVTRLADRILWLGSPYL